MATVITRLVMASAWLFLSPIASACSCSVDDYDSEPQIRREAAESKAIVVAQVIKVVDVPSNSPGEFDPGFQRATWRVDESFKGEFPTGKTFTTLTQNDRNTCGYGLLIQGGVHLLYIDDNDEEPFQMHFCSGGGLLRNRTAVLPILRRLATESKPNLEPEPEPESEPEPEPAKRQTRVTDRNRPRS